MKVSPTLQIAHMTHLKTHQMQPVPNGIRAMVSKNGSWLKEQHLIQSCLKFSNYNEFFNFQFIALNLVIAQRKG